MRDRLQQTDTKDLDVSCAGKSKPANKGASIDFVNEGSEVWRGHRVSEVRRQRDTCRRRG